MNHSSMYKQRQEAHDSFLASNEFATKSPAAARSFIADLQSGKIKAPRTGTNFSSHTIYAIAQRLGMEFGIRAGELGADKMFCPRPCPRP